MKTTTINYSDEDTELEGTLVYDDAIQGPRPTVLVVHDWSGRNEFAVKKAEALAALGYAGFAIDMYGKGQLGQNNEEKAALMTPLTNDRSLLRRRISAAFNTALEQDVVDNNNIACIGFCFGGLCALDLARSGADIKGVISFHGLLHAPDNLPNEKVNAKVLALHGHVDPMVSAEQIAGFQKEMTDAGVDWQMHVYGNTLHAFTNPEANDPGFGTVYSEQADKRSWVAMQDFLAEMFL